MDPQSPEISISFILSGKSMNLSEITEQLNITPTRVRTLNDWPESIKNPKAELPDDLKPCYIWRLDLGYENCQLVRDRFDIVLNLLKEKESVINRLKKRFSLEISFSVGIHAQHDQHNMPEIFLTQDIIAFVASIKASIGFDMYLD
jgi:hypothetical protein